MPSGGAKTLTDSISPNEMNFEDYQISGMNPRPMLDAVLYVPRGGLPLAAA